MTTKVPSRHITSGSATNGQVLVADGLGGVGFGSGITIQTAQATTSGTAFDFIIPSGTKRIQVMLNAVSLSGTDNILVQIGNSTPETSGYVSASGIVNASQPYVASSTAGFVVRGATASDSNTVVYTLVHMGDNKWVGAFSGCNSAPLPSFGGGVKTTGGEVTTLRVTRSGTNTFDAGSVNVSYE